MTPLEELQTAYKRLSKLRDAQTPTDGWWTWDEALPDSAKGEIWADYPGEDEARDIGQMKRTQDADLIVTLHRTIDAQLIILERAIAIEKRRWDGDAMDWNMADYLRLARAINGGSNA